MLCLKLLSFIDVIVTEDNLPDCQSSRKFEPDYGYKEVLFAKIRVL